MFLTQSLHKAARERPQALATVCGARSWTHGEFISRVARCAAALHELGVRAGDRVALLSANADHYLELLYGCWWMGAVANPVNTRWTDHEIAYSLDDCGTALLLVDAGFAPRARLIRERSAALRSVVGVGEDAMACGLPSFEALLDTVTPAADVLCGGSELAAVMYTGGTTGQSKGVMLSHDNLASCALAALAAVPRSQGAVGLHAAPLFHVGGLSFVLQLTARGATQVVLPAFDAKAVLAAIETHGVTELFLVPTMLKMLIEHPRFAEYRLDSVRTLIYGAAPMDDTLLDAALQCLPGVDFVQAYGMTEAAPVVTLLPAWFHTAQGRAAGKLKSAGLPLATAEVRIADPCGNECSSGEAGEILVRGPTVMCGYWNKPGQTAAALRDGWLHTGDAGYLDADGMLFVVDRIKDMIISGGENVYSAEVENAILKCPKVSMCAVIGLPDERWGQRVHAFVVLRDGETLEAAELIAHCRELIAGYKCPRSVEFRDDLPLSAAGKLLKYRLRPPVAD